MKLSHDEMQSKIDAIIRHKEYVKNACLLLSEKLVRQGRHDIGLKLVELAYIHDISKFHEVEFCYLNNNSKNKTPEMFEVAFQDHVSVNMHHAEYWHGFHNMPEIYIAELACDWLARSQEFGTDVLEWIENSALKKYEINKESLQYKWLCNYLNLLLEDGFGRKESL